MKVSNQRVPTFSAEELPSGWAVGTIREVVGVDGSFTDGDWVESKDQDPDGDVRLIQLADVGDGAFRDRSNKYLTHAKAIELRCTFLDSGDILIARMPDPLGRACIFPGDPKRCVTAVDVCIVRTGTLGANHHWVKYAVNSPAVRAVIASLQSGSTRNRISRKNLARIELAVPPLPEQQRIVAKIEELFTQLDAGVAALEKAKVQLQRYRQAVLKAAMEGELTKQWRDAHKGELEPASVLLERILKERRARWEAEQLANMEAKGKVPKDDKWKERYKEPSATDAPDLPDLPEGWVCARVQDIGEVVTGTTPRKSKAQYYGNDFPFYKPTDLNAGYYTKQTRDGLSSLGAKHARLLPAKSTLVTCIGATIGKTGFSRVEGATNQQINALTPDKGIVPEFAYFVCVSPAFQKRIIDNASATTLPILNKSKFKELLLPVPPRNEQEVIVKEIERRLSLAEEVDKPMEQSLRRAERLRQSILKRAFEGKLVPQEPTDEPASVLLSRIKAEKSRCEAEKKTRNKKPRKDTPQQLELI